MKIKLKNSICTVNLSYSDDSKSFVKGHSLTNKEDIELPFQFNLSGSWQVHHNCANCDKKTYFGRDERIIWESPQQSNFIILPPLFEKYYSKEELHDFFSLLDLANTFESNDALYILSEPFNPQYFLAHAITLAFYKCDYCESQYFVSYSIKRGNPGDRGPATPDLMQIIELKEVEINTEKDLLKKLIIPFVQ